MKTKSFSALLLGLLLVLGALTRLVAQSRMVVYLSDGSKYFQEVALVDSIGFEEHEYVDLGLPSGTLWATCNVGANSPEEYGDYFAWGETRQKASYSWSTYKYGTSSSMLTKYCSDSSSGLNGYTDTLTVLDPDDDAATANWGSGWCMPTYDEIYELYTECSSIWTTRSGQDGRLFTGPNGNTLFLPAAGYYNEGSLKRAGSLGNYWSSSHLDDYPDGAYYLRFNSDYLNLYYDGGYYGRSVRPVVK